MAVEVEFKFPLLNPEAVMKSLGPCQREDRQKDKYLDSSIESFLEEEPVARWLRVRRTPDGDTVNLKHWHTNENRTGVSCDEYESGIEDADAVESLLAELGFKPIVEVDKLRRIWLVDSVEIAIDEVTGLGAFIELEMKGDFENVEDAKRHLTSVLSRIDAQTGEQDFDGYPLLLLKKTGRS